MPLSPGSGLAAKEGFTRSFPRRCPSPGRTWPRLETGAEKGERGEWVQQGGRAPRRQPPVPRAPLTRAAPVVAHADGAPQVARGPPQVARRWVGDVVVAAQGMVQAGGLGARSRPARHAVRAARLVHHAGVGAGAHHAGAGLCGEAQRGRSSAAPGRDLAPPAARGQGAGANGRGEPTAPKQHPREPGLADGTWLGQVAPRRCLGRESRGGEGPQGQRSELCRRVGGFVHPQPAGPAQPAAPMAPAPCWRGGTAGPGVLPGRCKHCLKPSLLLPLFSCRIGRRLGICNSQLATHISCPKFYCAVQSLTGKAFQRGGLAKVIIIILTVLGRERRITALFNKTTKKGLDVWK